LRVTPKSIPAMVYDAVGEFAEREAVVDGEQRWTYADLGARIDQATRATIAAGLETGQRAAIWAPNIAEWIVAALGVLAAGGVLVPLNTRFKGDEAADILLRSGARLLFTVTGFLDTDYIGMLRNLDVRTPRLEHIVVLRGEAPEGTRPWGEFLAGGNRVDLESARQRAGTVTADSTSDLIFTSGTTGRPKGVMATHGQTLKVFEVWSEVVGLRQGDRYLIVNPFFHTFGYKAGILASLMRGATIVPHPVFDAGTVLGRIEQERITVMPGPPALYQSLLNHPDVATTDISSLRLAVTGAAVVPVELINRMSTDLGFDTVLTAYGLTEATGVVTMCRAGDDAETIATTCGCAIPETEIQVVADDGTPVAAGLPGEVVVRGYNVMHGYFEDSEQTAETIRGGWLHTGDIGVIDQRGYLRITDRKKDMYIVGGFNAYPAEIENVLSMHDDVAQAAVVGAPDERLGEVGVAFIVPRIGAEPKPDEIIAWCRERMANYKVPRRVQIVDALPISASGKVLKHELREHV
jgi:acyl-CoA synthetase (AMP-forming)/AMP-acid ligase II